MSAVLDDKGGLPVDDRLRPAAPSEGVWRSAWRRFRKDRVGLASMAIVAVFLLMILAAATGLLARNWQAEVGVPNAPPSFVGARAAKQELAIPVPKGPNVDLSDVDPLAPEYKAWEEKAKTYRTEESSRSDTLPLGGDRLGRDVLA
jgi:peptide/nickel transport system permease protein